MLDVRCSLPREGVVENESVEARVSHFQLPLNRLFMGIAACHRNQDLKAEQRCESEVELNLKARGFCVVQDGIRQISSYLQ